MYHRFYPGAGPAQRLEVANVRHDKFIVTRQVDGPQRGGVEQSQGKMFAQERDNVCSDTPARAGNENSFTHLAIFGTGSYAIERINVRRGRARGQGRSSSFPAELPIIK